MGKKKSKDEDLGPTMDPGLTVDTTGKKDKKKKKAKDATVSALIEPTTVPPLQTRLDWPCSTHLAQGHGPCGLVLLSPAPGYWQPRARLSVAVCSQTVSDPPPYLAPLST